MLYDDNEQITWSTILILFTGLIMFFALTGTALFFAGKYLLSFL